MEPTLSQSLPPADLVLQGGGVKGVALAGAVDIVMQNYDIRRVAGTSAGAILACLVAAGFSAAELRNAMQSLPYDQVPDHNPPLPLLGPASDLPRLFSRGGLHPGDFIEQWIADQLAQKGVKTFADLRLPPDPDADPLLYTADRGYKLLITATDITRGRALRLPWDYREQFGLEPAKQSVARAVRMSMSIPLYFVPCSLTNTATGQTSKIVDGGVLSNFPLELFDRQDGLCPRWPTFGVGVIPDLPGADSSLIPHLPPLPPPFGLLEDTIATAICGHDQTYLGQPRNSQRLIRIDTTSVGVVQFGIDQQQRAHLFTNGASAATAFFATWNWQAYLARFCPPRAISPAARGVSAEGSPDPEVSVDI